MDNKILEHYKQTGLYTNYGPYKEYFMSLPDDIYALRDLVNNQHIHKMSLYRSFKGENNNKNNLKYKWENYRCLDDVLLTATAMTAELFRLNGKDEFLVGGTDPNKKLVITCRYVAVLFASILKAKGIPCRCRSGFAPYLYKDQIVDHWIVQYYDKNFNKWVNVDAEANLKHADFNIRNFDDSKFIWAADAWLKMRKGKLENKEKYDVTGVTHCGDMTFAWSLMMDFHALFHDEINYVTMPVFLFKAQKDLYQVTKTSLLEMDKLARLMLDVDKNFDKLKQIWETNKKFRCVASCLQGEKFQLQLDKKDFS